MQTAVAVELEEEVEIAQEENAYNAALARWVAGIEEDLKALDEGTMETWTLEEYEPIRQEFLRRLKEKYAGH